MSLPPAEDLFRPTQGAPEPTEVARPAAQPGADQAAGEQPDAAQADVRGPSGRVRHDEKMTVYVTSEELLDIEHARLALRRTHGLAVDRGRLVRVAVALALADLEAQGEDSALVRRLGER